ncbi:MAG TPA: FAD:protein FMN transferase [Kofleriaceae bacterium]|nr:FAD:protein FMN transferase [Kofleriaceae bacterium]
MRRAIVGALAAGAVAAAAAIGGLGGCGESSGQAEASGGSGSGSAAAGSAGTSAATVPAASAAPREHKVERHGKAMGTAISVYFWTDDDAKAARAAEAVFAEMQRLDRVMTTWLPDSEVSQINAAAGEKPVAVSEETFEVIARAQDIAVRTRGVFDITVGAFAGLWKFDQDMDGTVPDPAEVKRRLARVGYQRVVLDRAKRTVYLRKKGVSITLGGIAKGYAVDRCAALLRQQGFANFMVQAGGDMYVAGKKGKDPWIVGIRDPRSPDGRYFALAPVEDHSFSTSGDYERGFVKDGVRYHHILDPRTGQPARASRSVTIRAKDAFTADAWSKVMFILGPKEAFKLIQREKLEDFEAIWVDDKNEVVVTEKLKAAIVLQRKPTPGI